MKRAAVAAVVVAALAGCSSSGSDDSAGGDGNEAVATMTEACAEARSVLAAAPDPVDDASDRAFLDAGSQAAAIAYTPGFDIQDEAGDEALFGLVRYLGEVPSVIGARNPLDVAYLTRAIIPFLDGFAAELGVPDCGAEAWRVDDYEAITQRLSVEADEAGFVQDLNAACLDAFGGVTSPLEPGGQVSSIISTRAAVVELLRQALFVPVPESQDKAYVDLLAALVQYNATVGDVERDPQPVDLDARVERALSDLDDAAAALGVTC